MNRHHASTPPPAKRPDATWATLRDIAESNPDLKKRGHFGSIFSANQYQWVYQQVALHCSPFEPTLDWGCGNGHFSLFLCDQGFTHVDGFAFREPSLSDLLKQRSTFQFYKGERNEAIKLPFEDASYQTVFSVGVLEHVREFGGDELESMREINRILRDRGVFICAHLPNKYSLIELIARATGKNHHAYTFTQRAIKRLCNQSGFTPLTINRYGLIPRNSFSGNLAAIGNHPVSRAVMETLDSCLNPMLNAVSQNFGFVAVKNGHGFG